MVLKADQDRLQTLLREAIPMMCKNGVPYKEEFCIEALIGITVDQKDVFLVSIKESFKTEAAIEREQQEAAAKEAAATPQKSPQSPKSPRSRKRRRSRGSVNSEHSQSDNEVQNVKQEFSTDLNFGDESHDYNGDGDESRLSDVQDSVHNSPQVKAFKRDSDSQNDSFMGEDEELVVIKEEPPDPDLLAFTSSSSHNQRSQYSSHSQSFPPHPRQQDPVFSHSFGSQSGSVQQDMSQSPANFPPGNPQQAHIPLESAWLPFLGLSDRKYMCNICGYVTKQRRSVRKHIEARHFKMKTVSCQHCNKQLPWKSMLDAHVKKCSRRHAKKSDTPSDIFVKPARNITESKWAEFIGLSKSKQKYMCIICGYLQKHRDKTKKHIEKSHPKLVFICQFCDRKCTRKRTFDNHMKKCSNLPTNDILAKIQTMCIDEK